MNGTALPVVTEPSSRVAHRFGIQTVDRPATNWAANSTVITSNTWVIPPVGAGSAGTNIKNRMVTAKAFSAKTSVRLPSVFGESPSSHASSWSLNGWPLSGSPHPQRVRPGPWSRQRGRDQELGAASTGVREEAMGRLRPQEPTHRRRAHRQEPGARSVPVETGEPELAGRPAPAGRPAADRAVGSPAAVEGNPGAAAAMPAGGRRPQDRHPGTEAALAGPGTWAVARTPVVAREAGSLRGRVPLPPHRRRPGGRGRGVRAVRRTAGPGPDRRPPHRPRPRHGACGAPRAGPRRPRRSRIRRWPARPVRAGRPALGTAG